MLLLAFVVVPLIEISLFIQVGGLIGLWPTLLIVVASAVGGVWVMRRQGAATVVDMQRAFVEFRDPSTPFAHGALIMLAGALLVIPGFFTDFCGLALLIPPVRKALMRQMRRRFQVVDTGFGGPTRDPDPHRYGGGTVIDGDYLDEDNSPPHAQPGPRRPSGWTRPDLH